MLKKSVLFTVVVFSTSSCLLFKDATSEKIDQLKKESEIAQNIEIPEDWVLNKGMDTGAFDFHWISELYNDELGELIALGLKHNNDIIIAEEKLNQVELAIGVAAANLYPSVNAMANTSNNVLVGSPSQNLSLQASWELDLWGKNKATKMASVSRYFSAKYQNDKAKQTIVAMIAKSYFLNIAGKLQEEKIVEYLKLTKELEALYKLRINVGTANAVDLSNIRIELLSVENYLVKVKNANLQSRRALELLLGSYPEGKIAVISNFKQLDTVLPSEFPLPLLENRPDVLAQLFLIEEAFYEVQQAKAARLPNLSLTSSLGTTGNNSISELFSNPVLFVGSSLTTPLFQGGALKSNVEIKNVAQKLRVEEYSKTVLNAVYEIESSSTNLEAVELQKIYNQSLLAELDKNIQLTRKQIEIGTSSNFELLQKQRTYLQRSMNEIDLMLQERVERINLYLALGAPGLSLE